MTINEIFAQREFEVDGVKGALKLLIGKPQPDGDKWCCEYQLIGGEDEKMHKVYGADSMQALLYALYLAKGLLHLYASEQHKIAWMDASDFGFAVIKTIED